MIDLTRASARAGLFGDWLNAIVMYLRLVAPIPMYIFQFFNPTT